jgi:hypothetical protein
MWASPTLRKPQVMVAKAHRSLGLKEIGRSSARFFVRALLHCGLTPETHSETGNANADR